MAQFDLDRFLARVSDQSLDDDGLKALLADARVPHKRLPNHTFPLGIVVQDGRRAVWELAPDEMGSFVAGMADPQVRGIKSWRVFPIGIVKPEKYRLEVDLGPPNG